MIPSKLLKMAASIVAPSLTAIIHKVNSHGDLSNRMENGQGNASVLKGSKIGPQLTFNFRYPGCLEDFWKKILQPTEPILK